MSIYVNCLFFRAVVGGCTGQMKTGLISIVTRKFLEYIGDNLQQDWSCYVSLCIELVII